MIKHVKYQGDKWVQCICNRCGKVAHDEERGYDLMPDESSSYNMSMEIGWTHEICDFSYCPDCIITDKHLKVGTKVKLGKLYCNGRVEFYPGQIIELIEGCFEEDNGLYTTSVTCPSIRNEDENDFDSIYHLFGNDFEYFMDCEIIEANNMG